MWIKKKEAENKICTLYQYYMRKKIFTCTIYLSYVTIYFQMHLQFSNTSYQASESFLLKLRPATHLESALLHSFKASAEVFRAATTTPPTLQYQAALLLEDKTRTTRLPNSAFHYQYPNPYFQFHPLLPQLQPQCYLFIPYVSILLTKVPIPPCSLPATPTDFRQTQRQLRAALTIQKSFVRTHFVQSWELHTPETSPASSQLWPGHPCCSPSSCCSSQDTRWDTRRLSAPEEPKLCLLPSTQTHSQQHTQHGNWKIWSGAIYLPSLPTTLHHLGPLACTITPFATDKGKSYILCQDETVPSLPNYTFHRNSNKVFWAQYCLSLSHLWDIKMLVIIQLMNKDVQTHIHTTYLYLLSQW